MIFIFLSCREKAYDNKEFSRESSKPRRETRITTCSGLREPLTTLKTSFADALCCYSTMMKENVFWTKLLFLNEI